MWIHALLNGEHAHLIGTAALDDALTPLRTDQFPAATHLYGALHSTRKLRFFDMDLLWATFGASGTARFPDRICEVCTAPLQHRIQLWFRPHGMMQAYGGDPSGCLLTLSHRITQSTRPLWHTAQTMSRAHARTHARADVCTLAKIVAASDQHLRATPRIAHEHSS